MVSRFESQRDLSHICAVRSPAIGSHKPHCTCIGADERCFAHFIETAATGRREDALLLATLMVREDAAPLAVAHAQHLGLALMRMDIGDAGTASAGPRNDNPETVE